MGLREFRVCSLVARREGKNGKGNCTTLVGISIIVYGVGSLGSRIWNFRGLCSLVLMGQGLSRLRGSVLEFEFRD